MQWNWSLKLTCRCRLYNFNCSGCLNMLLFVRVSCGHVAKLWSATEWAASVNDFSGPTCCCTALSLENALLKVFLCGNVGCKFISEMSLPTDCDCHASVITAYRRWNVQRQGKVSILHVIRRYRRLQSRIQTPWSTLLRAFVIFSYACSGLVRQSVHKRVLSIRA